MPPKPAAEIHATVNPFTARDVAAILRERGWLRYEDEAVASGRGLYLFTLNPEGKPVVSWMGEAAAMLGPRAETREELVRLLALIFEYDAREVLASRECQEVLAREGTRQVLRALATEILKGGPVDSNRLKEIVASIKATLPYSSREIFHPLRVAITGRVGGGAFDRVVLLLDRAAHTEGLAPVKSVRTRILEFCAALD